MGKSAKKAKRSRRFTDATHEAMEPEVYPHGTLDLAGIELSGQPADKEAADKKLKELQKRLYQIQVRYWQEKRRALCSCSKAGTPGARAAPSSA